MTFLRKIPSSVSPRAFTLVELLLASAVFSVLAAALYGVLNSALQLREKGNDTFENEINRSACLQTFQRDMQAMVVPNGTLAGAMLGEADTDGNHTLEFHASSGIVSDSAPYGDIQKIRYLLKKPEDIPDSKSAQDKSEPGEIIREVTRNLLTLADPEPEEQRLLDGVQALSFQYLNPDGLTWEDSWDSSAMENRPPVAVRVQIELAETGDDNILPAPLELVCEIPTGASDDATTGTATSGGIGP